MGNPFEKAPQPESDSMRASTLEGQQTKAEPEKEVNSAFNNEKTINEKALKLERDFRKIAEIYAETRTHSRNAQIDALEQDGARPFKIFVQIASEYSRADNIFCGINGEADHRVISQYLKDAAQTEEGDTKDVLTWLADAGERLADHREIVRDFLILDQLTDQENYREGRVIDENTTFFNSSLGDIDLRVLPEEVKSHLVNKLSDTREKILLWKDEREQFEALGNQLLPFINPRNPEAIKSVVENGARMEETGKQWREAIESAETWVGSISQTLNEGSPDGSKINSRMLEFMSKLTGAEAILEAQYYHIGVGLLRAAASDSLPANCREILKAELV